MFNHTEFIFIFKFQLIFLLWKLLESEMIWWCIQKIIHSIHLLPVKYVLGQSWSRQLIFQLDLMLYGMLSLFQQTLIADFLPQKFIYLSYQIWCYMEKEREEYEEHTSNWPQFHYFKVNLSHYGFHSKLSFFPLLLFFLKLFPLCCFSFQSCSLQLLLLFFINLDYFIFLLTRIG